MAGARPLSQRKVIKILESNGFERVRSSKHITYKKNDNGKKLTTYVPPHNEVSVFVLRYIIQQTGKAREEFW